MKRPNIINLLQTCIANCKVPLLKYTRNISENCMVALARNKNIKKPAKLLHLMVPNTLYSYHSLHKPQEYRVQEYVQRSTRYPFNLCLNSQRKTSLQTIQIQWRKYIFNIGGEMLRKVYRTAYRRRKF